MQNKHISKLLSLALRHQPDVLGIRLDGEGWASVAEVLANMTQKGLQVDRQKLQEVVETNDKKRFSFNADGSKIRANQGHSLPVDLGLQPAVPPTILYHGTGAQHVPAILKEGLQRRTRQHVHLSEDPETAHKVGSRHGKAVILSVRSGDMHGDAYSFYYSANGVWLTEAVPAIYIELKKDFE